MGFVKIDARNGGILLLRPEIAFRCVLYGILKVQVIQKSFRDFRPLRYSSRDGHAEGEHVNRGRDTPNLS